MILETYKIGFIDDDTSLIQDYTIRLSRKSIELLFVKDCTTKRDVLNWILKNNIKCMLVDYKLVGAYAFNGTELLAFINSELPDLPCIILTNYREQGISENLVIKNLFWEREVLDSNIESNEFGDFIDCLKQAVKVFNNRIKKNILEYKVLKNKKEKNIISSEQEERMLYLYKLLKSYKEIDDLPSELLTTSITKKMEDILLILNELIDKDI